jgi:hypothetical protein
MWLIHALGYCVLGAAFWAMLVWPASFFWSEYWHARQKRLRASQGENHRKYREERLFERIDLLIIVLGIPAAFVLTMLCRDWWGG